MYGFHAHVYGHHCNAVEACEGPFDSLGLSGSVAVSKPSSKINAQDASCRGHVAVRKPFVDELLSINSSSGDNFGLVIIFPKTHLLRLGFPNLPEMVCLLRIAGNHVAIIQKGHQSTGSIILGKD